jgi:putative OPT family oligopeptide transporter
MSTGNDTIKEFTFTAVFLGIIIGVVMTAANVYLGLYAGMTVSASIPAAVISMGIFSLLKKKSIHESNIVQTMASAGESLAAGVIFTLPALVLVGAWHDFKFWPTTMIAVSGGLLGVIFMIPLRKALIIEDKKLVYPEGVACAAVLEAGTRADSSKGFVTIIKGLVIGGAFKFMSAGFGMVSGSVELARKFGNSTMFAGTDISPALLSVGYIVKLEVAVLVFIGGAIGWFFAIPALGTPTGLENLSALDLSWHLWSKQIRYLGVGAMITGGLWSIVSVRKGIAAGLTGLKDSYKQGESKERTEQDMPLAGMLTVFLLCFFIMFFLYNGMINHLGLSLMTTAIMIVASFLFVAVSSYIVGLVGSSNNPVSGMTISALLATAALFLVLGFRGDSAILSTLGVAAVVCCAACTAGDCSQDLKTGSIIGATPKYQQYAQIIGVIIPALVIAPVLSLLHNAYGIGTGLKAPQATLFASITKALFGKGDLPYNMVIIGIIAGVVILVIDGVFLKDKKFRLHLMPIAVGIYLPVTLAVPILLGGVIRYIVEKKTKGDYLESEDQGVLISSGFIAGEAIMGVIVAVFLYFKINLKVELYGAGVKEIVSVGAFAMISFYLYKVAKQSTKA